MSAELIKGKVRVTLDCIGEGWNGDYNEDDPEDEYLMRFDVYVKNPKWLGFEFPYEEWYPLDDCSYCTAFPEKTSQKLQKKAIRYIMNMIQGEIDDYNRIAESIMHGNYEDGGLKKLCERLSWIAPSWVS